MYILASKEFNIGKIYYKYKQKLINEKNNTLYKKRKDAINKFVKETVYDIYYVLEGLYKMMFCKDNFNSLEEYTSYTFEKVRELIRKRYGDVILSYKNIDYIYQLYKKKQLKYFSIHYDILNDSNLKDHIVTLFIINNFHNYNERHFPHSNHIS